MASLFQLDSFGNVAAEDDPVLNYFVSTNSVDRIRNQEIFLVLGRKGTGKTALVRYFTEGSNRTASRALTLGNYSWNIHSSRVDLGAAKVEAYVASWRYVIATQLASLVIQQNYPASASSLSIEKFLNENYGSTNPELADVLRPDKLKLGKASFAPAAFGFALGSIDLERSDNKKLGHELNLLTDCVLDAVCTAVGDKKGISVHFDELDQGMTQLDEARKDMVTGLILAVRGINSYIARRSASAKCVIYLRTDIWDDLQFSDKNKISNTNTLHLRWDSDRLFKLIEERLKAKIGSEWADVVEEALMRGSQSKWNHILARTFLRPRDVIAFLNIALDVAKMRKGNVDKISNQDIVNSREQYSVYLKKELDDMK